MPGAPKHGALRQQAHFMARCYTVAHRCARAEESLKFELEESVTTRPFLQNLSDTAPTVARGIEVGAPMRAVSSRGLDLLSRTRGVEREFA